VPPGSVSTKWNPVQRGGFSLGKKSKLRLPGNVHSKSDLVDAKSRGTHLRYTAMLASFSSLDMMNISRAFLPRKTEERDAPET
jgi:hypothetical protein